MTNPIWRRPSLFIGILSAFGLLTAIACGSSPTPTATSVPPTATATPRPATPTPTTAPGTTATVVAQPTATATATPTPVPSVQPKRGGVIKQNSSANPISFDPTSTTGGNDNTHNAKMYSLLLWNPDANDITVDAAESYTISADGKVWTFKLRPNIKFHTGYKPTHPRDGTTMTSKDVKYSLEKIMGLTKDVLSPRSGWMKEFVNIDRPDHGIEIVDDLTFKVHLIQPFGGLANVLTIGYSGLLPDGVTAADMAKRPYGSGPYRLKDYQSGALWTYERNPDYFKAGLPYLDQYQFTIMDGDAIIQASFLTGKLDVIGTNPSPDNKAIFEQRVKSGQIYMAPRDSGCRPQTVNMNSTKPPFNDKRLRDAINLGIDRQAYTEVVHYGFAVPHLYLETDGLGRSSEEIMKLPGYRQPHSADFAEAKKIINELYPKGLSITQMVRNTSTYMIEGEFIAGELTKLGLNVTIQLQEASIVFDRAAKLDYTLWTYYFCQTTNTPEELFGGYFVTGGSRNWYGYSDPKIDAEYLRMAAITDPVLKKQKAQEMEDYIYAFLPVAPTPMAISNRAHYNYVMGYPRGISQYTREKNELMWRSDI